PPEKAAEKPAEKPVPEAAPSPPPPPAAAAAEGSPSEASAKEDLPSEASAKEGGRVESIEERIRRRSSPLVRKIASEHAVDITQLEGTGIHSRVTKNDTLSYIENRRVAAAPAPAEAPAARPAEALETGRAQPQAAPAPA